MPSEPGEESPTLSPDDAFAVLGDETRMGILRALGDSDGPLSFSELRDRVGVRDSGQFNYHLDRLVGHFVADTDDGYELHQAGRRVVEAVLSGAVTEAPTVERTRIDRPCFLCGARVEMEYGEERVALYCPECGGTRGGRSQTVADWADPGTDLLGYLHLPPAGVRDRTPAEIREAAEIWTMSEGMAAARDVCPRCSATLTHGVRACADHDATDGRCDRCEQRFAITLQYRCTNCIWAVEVPAGSYFVANTDLMAFMLEHGVDPLAPAAFHLHALEETVLSTDPLEARLTFTADGDALTLTVGADLSVSEVTRHGASETV